MSDTAAWFLCMAVIAVALCALIAFSLRMHIEELKLRQAKEQEPDLHPLKPKEHHAALKVSNH